MSRHRRERGSAALEVAGLLPLILMTAVIVLQMGVVGWTLVATGQAARDASRAATLGEDPGRAASAALPGILAVKSLEGGNTGDSERYTVTVKVPSLVGISLGDVSRTVQMPDIR